MSTQQPHDDPASTEGGAKPRDDGEQSVPAADHSGTIIIGSQLLNKYIINPIVCEKYISSYLLLSLGHGLSKSSLQALFIFFPSPHVTDPPAETGIFPCGDVFLHGLVALLELLALHSENPNVNFKTRPDEAVACVHCLVTQAIKTPGALP